MVILTLTFVREPLQLYLNLVSSEIDFASILPVQIYPLHS